MRVPTGATGRIETDQKVKLRVSGQSEKVEKGEPH